MKKNSVWVQNSRYDSCQKNGAYPMIANFDHLFAWNKPAFTMPEMLVLVWGNSMHPNSENVAYDGPGIS
jgi:hypothetical protein